MGRRGALRVAGEPLLDALGGAALGELVRHADAVEDGAVVGGAVADDADAAHAEQGRAAIFAVVEAAAELVEGAAGEQRAHLGGHGAGKRLAQHFAHKAAYALAGFERHVADKAVADDDVGQAAEDVAALHVADEADGQRLEQRKGLAGEVVALGLFFADGEQADARLVDFEHGAGIHLAHQRELGQILGFAVHIGAHVEQHAGISGGTGHGVGQGRAVDAGQRTQHHLGGGHGRAGIARGDKARRLALAHQLEAHAHGAVALGSHRLGRLFVHADAFRGMVDDDGQVFVVEVFVEQVAQLRLGPDEMDAHGQSAAGEDRPANLRLRSFVGTYGVKRDVDEHGALSLTWLLP